MQAVAGRKLFVGNLAWTTDSGCLQSAFSRFGQVLDAVVMQDTQTGRSRGFGFITFSEQSEADAAIEGLNDFVIDGRSVRVNYANHQSGGGPRGGGGGGYRAGGGGGGYNNQSYGNGQGGGWAPDQAGNGHGGFSNHGSNAYQQGYGNGGGYGHAQHGQDNWRTQQNHQDSTNSGW